MVRVAPAPDVFLLCVEWGGGRSASRSGVSASAGVERAGIARGGGAARGERDGGLARAREVPRAGPRATPRRPEEIMCPPKPQNPESDETPVETRAGLDATPERRDDGDTERPGRCDTVARPLLPLPPAPSSRARGRFRFRHAEKAKSQRRRTLGAQAQRRAAHAVHGRERGRGRRRDASCGGVAADAHRGHRRGHGGHGEHRVGARLARVAVECGAGTRERSFSEPPRLSSTSHFLEASRAREIKP